MGVAHFLAERRLRADWLELGGVGVDCTELVLVLVEPAFVTSAMAAYMEDEKTSVIFPKITTLKQAMVANFELTEF